ncbi:TPA: hypothetical protein ACGSRL_004660 [Escherichia coli]
MFSSPAYGQEFLWFINITERRPLIEVRSCQECWSNTKMVTVGKLRVELEAEKQRAKDLFMENARLKSGIAGLIHLGIRYADVEVMRIAGDAQLSTPCTDSIINSIATGIRIKGE